MPAWMRAKMRSAGSTGSGAAAPVVSLGACSAPSAGWLAVSTVTGSGVRGSTASGSGASLLSGRLRLSVLQPMSGNLRRSGLTAFGQSALSSAPGISSTTPLASGALAGFHSARNDSSPACSICCSPLGNWRSSASALSWLRSSSGTRGTSVGAGASLSTGSAGGSVGVVSSACRGRARVRLRARSVGRTGRRISALHMGDGFSSLSASSRFVR